MNTNEEHIIDELKKGTTPLPGDDYFAQLKQSVFDKLEPTVKIVPLYRKPWFLTAVAASVAVIISVTFLFNGNEKPQPAVVTVDWNSVSRDEVLAYIDDNIEDFEAEALAQQLNEIPDWTETVDLSTETVSVPTTRSAKEDKYDELFKDVDREDILEYLEEEDIDLEEY
ncbi:MAG TPA: hypothetical protein VK151_06500 [Fluviicola sp.]|nr:hypothetical protein [Fluviicola sp.]